jgi:hypothetical protein
VLLFYGGYIKLNSSLFVKDNWITVLNYSRTEANPPLPFTKVEEVALEDVVNDLERATTKPLV